MIWWLPIDNYDIYGICIYFLPQACPFEFEVFTEESEGEIEIVSLAPFSPVLDPALCQLVKERGIDGTVRDGKESVITHTLITPHLTTIVVENKVKW